jgi:hypothetical protein
MVQFYKNINVYHPGGKGRPARKADSLNSTFAPIV